MAKTVYKENTYRNPERESSSSEFLRQLATVFEDEKLQLAVGIFLMISSFALFVALFSYFFTGKADQSLVELMLGADIKTTASEVENWMGLTGALVAHLLIFKWLGLGAFLLVPLIFLAGWKLAFKNELFPFAFAAQVSLFVILWTSVAFGTFSDRNSGMGFWGGGIGYFIAEILIALTGTLGSALIVLFSLILFLIYFFKIPATFGTESGFFSRIANEFRSATDKFSETVSKTTDNIKPKKGFTTVNKGKDEFSKDIVLEVEDDWLSDRKFEKEDLKNAKEFKTTPPKNKAFIKPNPNIELEIESGLPLGTGEVEDDVKKFDKGIQAEIPFDEENEDLNQADLSEVGLEKGKSKSSFPDETSETDQALKQVLEEEELPIPDGNYDPTLELSNYQKPTIELLDEQTGGKRQVSSEELEANKDKIVETLSNYGIGISQIKATIGPTVTLYEIIPEAGVRISKIKNLEDDIALSLAALGIRIIAPIPGKGTIGIEVPNKKREIVSMRLVVEDPVFKNSEKALPIVLGKSISNELVVADLTAMPHLLIAGATGQGKSVGINVFLASLLYKKHPAELKFVLVDPKKVELTLFNKIEKHFLAKLPGEDEAIVTDTGKVVNTLNSLCLEMEIRYNLLKEAACRNIKEYNYKFVNRRLNPKKGHKFLPYIVFVIDELADLMMTAGKEVELPIARIAQLARAVGIHMIVATQRPSVNVITGIIKANFPARLSFKVASKIDSRTILDAGGAEQLVGMGDLLFSMGSDIIRLQCAFLDTHEVERICDYINIQQGYTTSYELPEPETDSSIMDGGVDGEDFERDALFEEAARIIVMHQQGSTSLLQRRLKLGYNRAGRLIDQLEKYGIVGPFEGSKAREVLIPDEYALERLLSSLDK